MVFKIKKAPYLRFWKSNVSNMMFHVMVALLPATFASFLMFGFDAVLIVAVSVAAMLITEVLTCKFRKVEVTTYNYSTVVSGIIYALILPNDMPLIYVILGAVFGILVGKLLFGGLGANIFNPAGVGRAFIVLSFGAHLAYTAGGMFGVDAVTTVTPLAMAKVNPASLDVLNVFTLKDLFIGTIPGSLGETSALAILIGAVYLIWQKVADWRKMVAMVGIVAFLAFVVAMVQDINVIQYVLLHVFSGGLLFGAIFMITDPVTAPVTPPGRIMYALLAGILTFFIRLFGGYPEGVVFAILIMNMFTPAFDYHKFSTTKYTRNWLISVAVVVILATIITVVGVQGM